MRFLRVRFRLTEPVIAGSSDGDANTVGTYQYLPGSSIRGAIINRLGPSSQAGAQLLSTGETMFLNAYPAVLLDGRYTRALPASLSWRAQGQSTARRTSLIAVADDQPAAAFGMITGCPSRQPRTFRSIRI